MIPDYKALSRGNGRDMSPAAIDGRLKKVAELYELWKLLRTARRLPPKSETDSGNRQPQTGRS